MVDPIIMVWPYKKKTTWFRDFVSRCICYFTKAKYTHVAFYVNGTTYESTVMNNQNGVLKHPGLYHGIEYYIFKEPILEDKKILLEQIASQDVVNKKPYNFFKLLAMMIIYPTRYFWNLIGWVPFDKECFGAVCSEFVDETFKKASIDLFPGEHEGYTAPGDFPNSPLLEKAKI